MWHKNGVIAYKNDSFKIIPAALTQTRTFGCRLQELARELPLTVRRPIPRTKGLGSFNRLRVLPTNDASPQSGRSRALSQIRVLLHVTTP